jgi:ribosomal protein S18 acetylase RimI-like enzyme
MLQIATKNQNSRRSHPVLTSSPDLSRVRELVSDETEEVLEFLAMRPVHTVVMTSFILDNGLNSELNRGTFYGYRNAAGELEGIALIGHTTLVEVRSEDAMKALAFTAKGSATPIHLIMSGGNAATTFWNYLYGSARKPALECTELLFEVGFPFPVQPCSYELRLARPEELEAVAEAHAEVAEIECGVNPMDRDREGFLTRTLRRIYQNRVFVVYEGEKLVFKADIVAETDTVAYIEGVYVSPQFRGKGVGSQCLSKLCLDLLARFDTVCLLSNADFKGAHKSFRRAGMRNTGSCTTLFV